MKVYPLAIVSLAPYNMCLRLSLFLSLLSFVSPSLLHITELPEYKIASRGIRGFRTRFIRFRILPQPHHEVVEVLLPLVPPLQALLLQLGVVPLEQLLVGRLEPHRQGRTAHTDHAAAVRKLMYFVSQSVNQSIIGG